MSATPVESLNAALEGRYRIERELGESGMKVLKPRAPFSLNYDKKMTEVVSCHD